MLNSTVTACFLAAALVAADKPRFTNTLDEAAAELAGDLRKMIEANPNSSGMLRIGSFVGPEEEGVDARVAQALEAALQKEKVRITKTGGYRVQGAVELSRVNDDLVLIIEAKVFDAAGQPKQTLVKRVVTDSLAALSGAKITADLSEGPAAEKPLPPGPSADKAIAAVKDGVPELQKPVKAPAEALATVAKASVASPYGLEILRIAPGEKLIPLEVTLEAAKLGREAAFVQLNPTDAFAIRLHNQSPNRVGCAVTIDGVNVFAFSEIPAWRQLGKMVIAPGGADLRGWHKTDQISREFQMMKYADSAAAQFGVTQEDGAITAIFFEESVDARNPPRQDAPGQGREIAAKFATVPFRFGRPVAIVTIRYHRTDLPGGDAPAP